jgi:hypothetical protein
MKVPNFKEPEVTKFLEQFQLDLNRKLTTFLNADSANKSVLLYSPNKKVFEITVSDTGVITATKVQG